MIKAILASPIPVITWVSPAGARAGSAATFIAMAGDVLAMAPNTNIGAAAVVDSSGNNLPSTLDKKVTNDAVARITELAKAHDRNATWAESAVRDAASIGSAEAVAMSPPVADLLAENVNQLFAAIDTGKRADGYAYQHDGQPLPKLSGLPVDTIDMNFGQQFLHLLSDPNIAFILFTVGFYGIIAELFHPNFFSGTLGAIAIVLAWIGSNSLPLNIGGLLLILLGVGLFVLELHVTSYGLLTVGGVVCFILGAFALWTGVTPGQEAINVTVHPLLVGLVLALTLVYFYGLIRAMLRMRRQSPVPVEIDEMVGRTGVAQTLISPTGIAYAAGEAWSARSAQGEIAPGQTLRVVDVKGLELIVEPVGGSPPPAAASASEGDASHG
jgi:membrane-bound serine protease (ClpP class)